MLKISAAILGGYLVTLALHQFLMLFVNREKVYITMQFSGYILWAVVMVIAFLAKSGWKIWGWYLLTSALLLSPFIYKIISGS